MLELGRHCSNIMADFDVSCSMLQIPRILLENDVAAMLVSDQWVLCISDLIVTPLLVI